MSEDDRQAKAARAKALARPSCPALKKRQQKSAGKPGSSPPLSRTFTPIPSDDYGTSATTTAPTDEDSSTLGDVFGNSTDIAGNEGSMWLNSLTRVETPPLAAPQTPEVLSRQAPPGVNSPTMSLVQSLRSEMERQQNTISSLQSENRSLVLELDRKKALEASLLDTQESLRQERVRTSSLSEQMHQSSQDVRAGSKTVEEQQKTISTLRDERNGLLQSLKALQDVENRKMQTESLLRAEVSKNSELTARIGQFNDSLQETSAKMMQHQQTISLLVSEKTALTTSLERLEELEPRAQELEGLLASERNRSASFEVKVARLEASLVESANRLAVLSGQEKEIQNRSRELERELQLTNGSLNDIKAESDRYQRQVQELEERIQSDDRVEKLEEVLQNTQDRADELEFQLSKINQAHAALKLEHDDLPSQLQTWREVAKQSEIKLAELEARLSSNGTDLLSVIAERDTLLQEGSTLTSRLENSNKTIVELEEKLSQAAVGFSTNTRQLQNAQNEARKAIRRAEEAEKIQGDLQAEGMNLMRSLEEMRPKIVELTNIRLELVEKIESLEGVIRRKEDVILQLESTLEEMQDREMQAERYKQREDLMRKKDESSSKDSLSQIQKAYGELQAELEALRANLRDREAEREGYHRLALRRLEEVDRLTFTYQAQAERLASAEKELEERRLVQSEDQSFVEGMQNEIEALRNDLLLREEELERLRGPSSDLVQSLDGEMVSALRQQQTLELSNSRSQIRALESAVFESDARAHALQKQVSTLMDQLTQLRSISHTPTRPFSPTPGLPSRPSSRVHDSSDDLRRASLNSPKLSVNRAKTSSHRAFDSLSPETRHKRRVSLGMLKARIDSEVASSVKSRPSSRALTPLPETTNSMSSMMEASEPHHIRGFRRHQFLDESHIFWCNSCHGDLVIL